MKYRYIIFQFLSSPYHTTYYVMYNLGRRFIGKNILHVEACVAYYRMYKRTADYYYV